MKVTKEKAAANRAAIVRAAGRLFRARGFDGVGVAEITKAAGLTHGGFYGHFASKDALAAEACAQTFADSLGRLPGAENAKSEDLHAYLETYLSEQHRDRREGGCPMAAYVTEVARQDATVQRRFSEGVERFIDAIVEQLPTGDADTKKSRRDRAIEILSAMVGGAALARATSRTAPELSAEILVSLRRQLRQLVTGGKPR